MAARDQSSRGRRPTSGVGETNPYGATKPRRREGPLGSSRLAPQAHKANSRPGLSEPDTFFFGPEWTISEAKAGGHVARRTQK